MTNVETAGAASPEPTPPPRSRTARPWLWRGTRVAVDLLAGVAALGLAFLVRFYLPLPFTLSLLPRDRVFFLARALVMVLLTQNVTLYFLGFYQLPHPEERAERMRRLATASALHGALLISYFFLANRLFPRSVLVLFVGLNFAFLALGRAAVERTVASPRRRVLVIGSGADTEELASSARRYPWYGFDIVGHVRAPSDAADAVGPGPCLGGLEEVPRLLADGFADEIILTSPTPSWQTRLIERIAVSEGSRTSVLLLPSPFDSLLGGVRYRAVHDVPLIEVVTEGQWQRPPWLKRCFDLLAASVLLLITLPLLALSALAVRLSSSGPVLYRQSRIGRDQEPFVLTKLRTMRQDAEREGEEVLAVARDPRLTPVGRGLRALRLDELPQLLLVLQGRMSLVGPRPERPGFVSRYLREVPGYAARFALRPGLTGLAQIHGDYHTSAENKLRYDLAYLANWSIWLDLAILVRTVRIVLTSRGT